MIQALFTFLDEQKQKTNKPGNTTNKK